jgi:DNA-binding HxlR family transcriptional regulator
VSMKHATRRGDLPCKFGKFLALPPPPMHLVTLGREAPRDRSPNEVAGAHNRDTRVQACHVSLLSSYLRLLSLEKKLCQWQADGMKWHELSAEACSLSRALAVMGDRWTLLILRDAFLKVRRFEEFQGRLGIARRVLTARLAGLVEDGVLEKLAYQDRPRRFEYRLTKKGLDLYPVVLSLVHWGDTYYAGAEGPPVIHRHKTCGHDFRSKLTCSECGEPIDPRSRGNRAAGRRQNDVRFPSGGSGLTLTSPPL